jgi:hypothetical protein
MIVTGVKGNKNGAVCAPHFQSNGVKTKHYFRCCAESDVHPYSDGEWKKHKQCSVWASSVNGAPSFGSCPDKASFSTAEQTCAAIGLEIGATVRLCTEDELMDECTTGTGCQMNKEYLWSKTSMTAQIEPEMRGAVETSPEPEMRGGMLEEEEPPTTSVPTRAPTNRPTTSSPTLSPAVYCHMVATGRTSHFESADYVPTLHCELHKKALHVRCCSTAEKNPYPTGRWVKHAHCNVWAAGRALSTDSRTCAGKMTYDDAAAFCKHVGVLQDDPSVRLCTVDEMHSGCTDRTGCNTNTRPMWTSNVASDFV